jgi:hypothetical protein
MLSTFGKMKPVAERLEPRLMLTFSGLVSERARGRSVLLDRAGLRRSQIDVRVALLACISFCALHFAVQVISLPDVFPSSARLRRIFLFYLSQSSDQLCELLGLQEINTVFVIFIEVDSGMNCGCIYPDTS